MIDDVGLFGACIVERSSGNYIMLFVLLYLRHFLTQFSFDCSAEASTHKSNVTAYAQAAVVYCDASMLFYSAFAN
jgi:hypothetical protein